VIFIRFHSRSSFSFSRFDEILTRHTNEDVKYKFGVKKMVILDQYGSCNKTASEITLNADRPTLLALKILPNASKMARAGQRVDTSFSSHYYSFVKSG